jgi:hypothetical protein
LDDEFGNDARISSGYRGMMESSWTFLAIKLLSVPIFIWIVTVIGRRYGHSMGGLIVGLPLTSGPVLFFLAVEQGNSFAASAAQGILMALLSVTASSLTYSRLSFKTGWEISLVGSCVMFFVASFIFNYLSGPLFPTFVGVVAGLVVILKLFPAAEAEPVRHPLPKWEIPARILAATTVVVAITEAAGVLGPHLSGVLTPFPAYAMTLGVFTHKLDGAKACTVFLRGVVTATFTAAVFFFVVGLSILQVGLAGSIGLAVGVCLVMHAYFVRASTSRSRSRLLEVQ